MGDEKSKNGLLKMVVEKDSNGGCGCVVKGPSADGGPVKCINGQFYAPMPVVTSVLEGSPADVAGLCVGDFIHKV